MRFRKHHREDSDSELVPQKLDFSEPTYDTGSFKRPRKKNSKDDNYRYHGGRREKSREKSREKDKGYINKLLFGKNRDKRYSYFSSDDDLPSQTQVQDLRYIDCKDTIDLSKKWSYENPRKDSNLARP